MTIPSDDGVIILSHDGMKPSIVMYFIYLLLLKNKNIYTGFTTDLETRVKTHQRGKVKSTKNKSPKLIHFEAYKVKSDAQRRERFLKTTEGKRLLKKQIRDLLKVISQE